MKRATFKTTSLILAAVLAMPAITALAVKPATQPAAAPATQPTRDVKEIVQDIMKNVAAIQAAGGDTASLSNAAKRVDAQPKLIPLVHKQVTLVTEYAKAAKLPEAALAQMQQHNSALLYLLGDQDTVAKVNAAAEDPNSETALQAQSVQIDSQWIAAGTDQDAQAKVIDQLEKLDKAHNTSTALTSFTFSLSSSAASDDLADRLLSIAGNEMDNSVAERVKARIPMIQKQRVAAAQAAAKLKSVEGKPLVVAGKTVDGKDFSTGDWKGKVILVDFWATWCGPCKAELPRVKDMYAKYHDKGLEILSVSNDYSQSNLTDFTAKNKMPWPELFDADAASKQHWNPITLGYGINGIPTMFLIDKKGICRTVQAREKMEDLIPTLLAE